MPPTHLSPLHYAFQWKSEKYLQTPEEITELGIKYVSLPDGPERERLVLQLLQAFHGYLMKYLDMIVRGHLPCYGGRVNRDTKIFLQRFLPKGSDVNRTTLLYACRSLHLAFKQMESDEIYDILVMCLLKAIDKWDPYYTDKVRKVIDAINEHFPKRQQFTAYLLNTAGDNTLDFDSSSILHMLARRGFLEKIPPPKSNKPCSFRKSERWPPPSKWFEQGPVGLPYFVSSWFRYHLQQYITQQMKQIESSEDVLQLDHRRIANEHDNNYLNQRANESNIPSAEGQFTDASGASWLCDIDLAQRAWDMGTIDLKWVESTNDPLFRTLSKPERYLLYLVFARELGWKSVAFSLNMSVKDTKELYTQVLAKLSAAANDPSKLEKGAAKIY